jgi:hypothetical protein
MENGLTKPSSKDLNAMTYAQRNFLAEKRKKENKAKYWIQNSVDDSIFSKIIGASNAKQA